MSDTRNENEVTTAGLFDELHDLTPQQAKERKRKYVRLEVTQEFDDEVTKLTKSINKKRTTLNGLRIGLAKGCVANLRKIIQLKDDLEDDVTLLKSVEAEYASYFPGITG
jgi:hypothetical protein